MFLNIKTYLPKIWINTNLTNFGIGCSSRKCIFCMITAAIIDIVTITIVNNKYLAIKGVAIDVGGINSI